MLNNQEKNNGRAFVMNRPSKGKSRKSIEKSHLAQEKFWSEIKQAILKRTPTDLVSIDKLY